MEILSTAITLENSRSIAIGGFDGMHIGHQALFNELDTDGVIVVIEAGYANLTPQRYREHYDDHKIEYLKLENIRHLESEGFIELLQEKFPKLQKIVVGYDFHFGKDRKYSFDDLKKLFDGEVVVVDEVKYNDDSVHSHKIRAKLQIGDIKGANEFLGHNYSITGEQIKGQGIGSRKLVATINLKIEDFLLPKEGVYVTLTRIDDAKHFHPSVSFIGDRLSTDRSFAVESHILDGEVICEKKAEIIFVDFIRNNEKFDSIEKLKEAIKKDITQANKVLQYP